MAQKTDPNITLYTAQTPNGIKTSILLEELGLPYTVKKLDFSKNEQKEDWYLAINPNGRIPALTDSFDDGKQINLFESGSIMQYLVASYDKDFKVSFPPGSREFYNVGNWMYFMNAGVGPMQGQANHFFRYAPEKIEYGINRYQNETRRLYGVLENHLKEGNKQYLVGDKCTIADIAHWGWIAAAGWAGVDIEEFPNLNKWLERCEARPGFQKGMHVPDKFKLRELLKDKEAVERHAAESSKWIQQGMKEDADKQK